MSFVVRVSSTGLAAGALVGEVESVSTGVRAPFRSASELTAFCRSALAASAQPPLESSVAPRTRPAVDDDPSLTLGPPHLSSESS